MFTLCSEVKIGSMRFSGVASVEIERSVYELAATAVLTVPVTAVLKQSGEPVVRVETAKEIKRGDPVTIRLGYDGRLRDEFRGYVKNINLSTPVEIECEDEFYTCRARSITLKGTTTLADLLNQCGLTVQHTETLTLKNFTLKGKPTPSVAEVLAKLRTEYGLNMWFDLDGNFYAARPERLVGDTVKYVLRKNVIKDDDLTYRRADDVQIQINAVCVKKDGTRVEATKGSKEGASKTLYFYDVESTQELAALAEAELKRHSYDGYEGEIETFLAPYAQPTMVAEISDPVYGERDGRYYIESTKTIYGMGGARRTVGIGAKV